MANSSLTAPLARTKLRAMSASDLRPLRRRDFLRSVALAAGAGLVARSVAPAGAKPEGANGDVRLGVIGVGRWGSRHAERVHKQPGARLVALCDVDPAALRQVQAALGLKPGEVFATTDARALLERADVDAVIIASPHHWHALHAIWACQAGKDVFVEKALSHTVWEGVQMAAVAARHGRVVQTGTQARSDPGVPEAMAWLREGHLGRVLWAYGVCYKYREPIGLKPSWTPDWLDFDRYCGPAPLAPLRRNELHYDWHWSWDTGNGDMANIAVHETDVARWFTGHGGAPLRVVSLGGRFARQDAGETPNTQLAVVDYGDVPIFIETRGLGAKPGAKYDDQVQGIRQGTYVQCEGGCLTRQAGLVAYDRDGRKIRAFDSETVDELHLANFLAAVRSRRGETVAAPLEGCRVSTSTCHFANISYRVGAPGDLRAAHALVESVPAAGPLLDRMAAHLRLHGVDPDQPVFTLGAWVRPDAALADVAGIEGGGQERLAAARRLLKGEFRAGYQLPAPA